MTGRRCKDPNCKGILRDSIINFGETLPEEELSTAESNAVQSDLAVCWGTSMTVSPANELPVLTKKKNGTGKLVIINMQTTPKDKYSDLRIFAKVDVVMKKLMDNLGYTIPKFGNDYYKQQVVYGHTVVNEEVQLFVKGESAGTALCFFGLEKVFLITPSKRILLRCEPFTWIVTKPTTFIMHIYFYGIRKPIRVIHNITTENITQNEDHKMVIDFGELATRRKEEGEGKKEEGEGKKKKNEEDEKEKEQEELIKNEEEGDIMDENDKSFGIEKTATNCIIS